MLNKERKLDLDEKPLAVQLKWTTDNREGRFVLKTHKDSVEVKKNLQAHKAAPELSGNLWCVSVVLRVYKQRKTVRRRTKEA